MANCLTWTAWICFIGSILIGALMQNSEEGKKTAAWLVLGGFLAFLILGLFIIPSVENSETQANALQCLQEKYGTSSVTLSDPVCISSSRYGCQTWEANYRSGEDKGTIKYSINSCVLTP